MAKCAIEQDAPPPGMHGATRKRKQSDYGMQLSEKQRLRRSYGLQEVPFHLIFERAQRRHGITGEILLQLLEMRLDNLVYRFGFAPSRRAARQFVRHGHVQVDGRKASAPSMVLKAGSVVGVRGRNEIKEYVKLCMDKAGARGTSPWLSVDREKISGEVIRVPSRDEIAPIVNEQLIVELYSK